MRQFAKPKVVISKCIEFDHCRYDGSMIPSDFVKALKPYVDFLPVCAEMETGLSVPRDTVRIVSVDGEVRLMQPATNLDVKVSGLIQFQEANKFLLMAHSQKESRILGNIVANHEGLDYTKQAALYREHLAKALHRPPNAASKANVFMHCLGYFKDELSLPEKSSSWAEGYKEGKMHIC